MELGPLGWLPLTLEKRRVALDLGPLCPTQTCKMVVGLNLGLELGPLPVNPMALELGK